MSDIDFGQRIRIFFIGTLVAIWLCIVDGVKMTVEWNSSEMELWAKASMAVTGYLFCVLTLCGSVMILLWKRPKIASFFIVFSCLVTGIVRFVTVWVGSSDFWQETYLDSITSGVTHFVIIIFQIFIACEVLAVFRRIEDDEKDKDGYMRIGSRSTRSVHETYDHKTVEINDEAIWNNKNPFHTAPEPEGSNTTKHKSQFMKAYN